MAPNSHPQSRAIGWHPAITILFAWQALVACLATFALLFGLIVLRCIYECRPWSQSDILPSILIIIQIGIVASIIVEVNRFSNDTLSTNFYLAIQIPKVIYVTAICVWIGPWGYLSQINGIEWWNLIWENVLVVWPFLIALVYAVFKKIESTRIIADEERPLLGNAIQSPDVVG